MSQIHGYGQESNMRAIFANRHYLQCLLEYRPDPERLQVPRMSLNGDAVQQRGGKCLHELGIYCHQAATAGINMCEVRQ
jgi:hypothetical protein